MRILVTGAKGFVGQNLVQALKAIRDGKDLRPDYQSLLPLEVFEYDRDSTKSQFDGWCAQANFVFHLAGINRPKNDVEFMRGNFGFTSTLLETLERHDNTCPVMFSSSTQASLRGRFANSEYGRSKLAGEDLFRKHADRMGTKVLIYRFPNLYGKWCRPNYNSAVATFCNNVAHDLPITVNDPTTELDLLYVNDLVEEMLRALVGGEDRRSDGLCHAGPTDHASLGQIVSLLRSFKDARRTLDVPDVTEGSFSKKLYSTYLSYLDPHDLSYRPMTHEDDRGGFTELLKTPDRGQVSVNVARPGVTKGQHWHGTKWEKFCVVSGEGLIRLRHVGADESGRPYPVIEYHVSGEKLEIVEMVPGYTHSITNLSDTHDLVTLMWCNERFDPAHPDTFHEEV